MIWFMIKNNRILLILENLLKNSKVSVKELALKCETTPRTIQNDFSDLRDYFGEQLIKKGDSYSLLTPNSFANIFKTHPRTIKRFLYHLSVVDSDLYETFTTQYADLLKALNFNNSPIYQIENSPYEKLKESNKKILFALEEHISERNYINVYYRDQFYFSHCIPIKIVYLKENWYLALLTTNNVENNSTFKTLRINFIEKIKKVTFEPRQFHNDYAEKLEAEQFLKKIQSPFSSINGKTYTVKLQVSSKVARFFKAKRYLKSQKILDKLDSGELIISYEISHELEIIPLIQQWIPHLNVLEPLELKEKIIKNLEEFLKGV